VDATEFLTASRASVEALRTATLLKTLNVNALIVGERGTGKRTLANVVLPSAVEVEASDFDNLLHTLEHNSDVVLTHIEKCPNDTLLLERLEQSRCRVVATASNAHLAPEITEFFSVQITLPPLKERPEDVALLSARFTQEASELFGADADRIQTPSQPDLRENAVSLRRQIYFSLLLDSVDETGVMQVLERYLGPRLGSNNDYRKFLHLYEAPLIRVGLARFKSQLQLAERLGLNRNTLRKKIAENESYLKGV